jgi:predicted ArsR family transcriptional regulator
MHSQLLKSSRGQILRLLRRAPHSVNDLADALGVTDNAVRANLARLERDGLIRQVGRRPGIRKPESVYDITTEAERLFAKAYAPVLQTLLVVLESHLSSAELDGRLREVGRQMAARYLPAMTGLSFEQRVETTLPILEEMGGLAELDERNGRTSLIGFGCPFSEIIEKHPKLCLVVQAFVAELLGRDVQEQCQRGERSRCCFAVH